MRLSALSIKGKFWLATAAMLSLAAPALHAQPDPPAQGGRLSYITGAVSYQPAGSSDWGQAYPNLPLGPGDRLVTEDGSRAEIQVGQTFVRVGPNADVTLVDSTPEGIYFGVAQGSIHLHSNGLWDGQSVFVQTPSGSSTLSRGGDLRVDVWPDQPAALFSDFASPELLTGAGGFEQEIGTGQALELVGSNPVEPQWTEPGGWDDLDRWSHDRDMQIAASQSYQYVSPEVAGAYELDAAGSWQPGTPYGAVWFPNVEAGWAPYHNGHWVNHAPWGWVWIENESWGYAPFHYGRWVVMGGRWGWIPGPPQGHPVWSPALVVFAGGQPGVSVWFPLGPGEPYRPWYPCSPHYVDRVNITNITVTNVVHVQTTYVNFNFGGVVFANRSAGLVAVRNEDFASGRPVNQVHVTVNVNITNNIRVIAAPEPRPTPQSIVGTPPARPVRVPAARPVLINASGKAVSATPGARPVEPPVKPAPVAKPLPGHKAIAPPPNVKPGTATKAPVAPAKPETTAPVEPKTAPKPVTPPAGKPAAPVTPVTPKPETKPPPPPPPAKPAPAPETKTPPKPADKAAPEPGAKPGTPATARPGTTPPDKANKDKKNAKDKDKDKDEKDKDEKKPE